MKKVSMRIPDCGPLGETFRDAKVLAMVGALLVNSPRGGRVENVFTLATHVLRLRRAITRSSAFTHCHRWELGCLDMFLHFAQHFMSLGIEDKVRARNARGHLAYPCSRCPQSGCRFHIHNHKISQQPANTQTLAVSRGM
jgi:hypothetical protein